MACHINSLLVLGYDECTVEQLWTGALCKVQETLQGKLRPVEVIRCDDIQLSNNMGEMIPESGTSRELNWLKGSEESAYIFRNGANGARTDNVFGANDADSYVLFAEQTEDAAGKTLSVNEAAQLCATTNPFPRMSRDFPVDRLSDNYIIVAHKQLKYTHLVTIQPPPHT